MTNKAELKKSISNAFKEGDCAFAFEQLLSLPHHEVATILSKKKWLQNPRIANYFWRDFCLNLHETVFEGTSQETIINWYLNDLKQTNDKLNLLLINKYPEAFLKGIKRNRSFLNEKFLSQLIDYPWKPNYSFEILAWRELNSRFRALQSNIDNSWHIIKQLSCEVILSGIIHWIDVRFYKDYSDLNHEQLRQLFNYSLSFVLSKKKMDVIPTEEEFSDTFLKAIRSNQTKLVDPFLNSILDWLLFETTILTSYCFDDNFVPVLSGHSITFKYRSNEEHDLWIKDGERYTVNASRYYVEALQIYNYEDEEGTLDIPPGKSDQDEDINHGLYIQDWKSKGFLQDLNVRNLLSKEGTIHVSIALSALNSYSTNRRACYVEPMKSAAESGQSWYDSFISTIESFEMNEAPNLPLPFMFISRDDLTDIYNYAIPEFTTEDIHLLIEHFSFEMSDKWQFDPFNPCLSILETPFIRFGNFVFTSTSFFAMNEWFYSIAQRVLNLYNKGDNATERNETAREMEVALGQKFESKGWNVKIISPAETNAIDGDIDIFVDDTVTQVLIQLKRTKLKLDLASNYIDSMETDLKAAGQLNEAVISIRNGAISTVKIMPIHQKWIVTTSFEGVLKQIDGCTKVNYFDLLWALNHGKFTSLNDLKFWIESDIPFKEGKKMMDKLNSLLS